MSTTQSHVRPDTHLFLRLPNEMLKLVEIKLNTIVDVGKLGSFPSNLLLGRPYYHTYEMLEKREGELYSRLRIVSQAELNSEAGLDQEGSIETAGETVTPEVTNGISDGYDLVADDGTIIMKNNRRTVDDGSRQMLSQAEIEDLKKSSGGKEVIEKILASHTGLDEKTAFSKAKYMLRKHKKYLKRFSVLPMDMGNLIEYITEKEPARIMEMREESLGLAMAWSNAHYSAVDNLPIEEVNTLRRHGRWLVVDDTGGLLVAALAERMGILNAPDPEQVKALAEEQAQAGTEGTGDGTQINGSSKPKPASHRDFPIPASSNTITLLHSAVQPNLSILKYFGYDTSNPAVVSQELEHPLHTHLKSLSWLQLLHPTEDPQYTEPEHVTDETLASWKSGKRGTYFKKRRRWERCKSIVDEAREGGFDGLVIASHMDPASVLKYAVPLIRGGGHVVLFSPTIESLTKLTDLYSKDRRAAYMAHLSKGELPDAEDFPVDPRLLLAPTIQTSRILEWQVLPGRTHPLMTSKGGAEGYVFTARKVIPLEGGVEARGNFGGNKKRKVASTTDASTPAKSEPVNAVLDATDAVATPV